MKWINVNDNYLDFLREYENRIPRTNYGNNKYKPFLGILFEVDDLCYITQISHPKPRYNSIKQDKDFIKIFDPNDHSRLIAVVNLNYMFPIPKSEISEFRMSDLNTYRDFVSRNEQGKYSHLLNKELSYINSIDIATKAQNLYNLKYSRPEHIVSQRCIDFKKMEALALQFKNK